MINDLNAFGKAIYSGDVKTVFHALDSNAALAKQSLSRYNQISKETDEIPFLTLAYNKYCNDQRMVAIRQKLLQCGANINHQYPDGATLGHSFACVASDTNDLAAYIPLISWIQEGGDVSLKDSGGHDPLQVITLKGRIQAENSPGLAGVRAIIIGLDKRNFFPGRAIARACAENSDEIDEMTTHRPKLFEKLTKEKPNLRLAYQRDTVAYRALKWILIKNGGDINADVGSEAGGTLGHIFAMEAANRNKERYYLRLIRWIRDGGDLDKKDNLGMRAIERLYGYANYPGANVPFPGLFATLAILDTVNKDTQSDPAAATDSRMPKFNPYPNKFAGGCKVDRFPIADTKEGLENTLSEVYEHDILEIFNKGRVDIKECVKTIPCKIKLHVEEEDKKEAAPKPTEMPAIPSAAMRPISPPPQALPKQVQKKEEPKLEPVQENPIPAAAEAPKKISDSQKLEKLGEEFECPLSLEIMEDPVFAPDGQTYERSAIEDWLKKNGKSPLTKEPMAIADLKPNFAIKRAIARLRSLSK